MRALLLAVVVGLVGTAPALAAETLQPGALLGPGCTMNWVYDGQGPAAGRVFVGTAAHCVGAIGERITDGGGVEFGTVAVKGDAEADHRTADYALIEVDPEDRGRVEPSMAGHPEIPSRHIAAGEAVAGDYLQMSGWGGAFSMNQDTREQRRALLTENDGAVYTSVAPVSGGDSGGPIAHVDTGGPVGIVSSWHFTRPGNLTGPTVWAIASGAQAQGVPVRLRLAGEPPPPPPPPPPTAAEPPSAVPSQTAPPQRSKPKAKKRKACAKGKQRAKKRSKRCRKRR